MVSGGHFKEGAALAEWKHEAENFKKDMEFLLSLSQHEYITIIVKMTNIILYIVSLLGSGHISFTNKQLWELLSPSCRKPHLFI